MDNSKKTVCWIVKTKFSIGLYLADPKTQNPKYLKTAEIIPQSDFLEAKRKVLEEAEGVIAEKNFRCNRLMKIRDNGIYTVFYNRRIVGFTETEKLLQILEFYNISHQFVRTKKGLDYRKAQQFTSLWGEMPKTREGVELYPRCGRVYRRRTD